MKKEKDDRSDNIRKTRFPISLFWIVFGSLCLMSGGHTGMFLLVQRLGLSDILQTHIILLYWLIVAVGLTMFIRWQMRKTYETPLIHMSEATKRVAQGDFSVYIPTTHTADKYDYLDAMIIDMNKMIEELGSIETLKTDFVSNVSHEMKTPLSVIKNYAEMLQSETISDERRLEYAKSIDEASGKMSSLITNILKLNKLENQRIVPEIETYDVCRQLCECVIGFEELWEKKEIEMEVDMEEEAFVKADENLLELVWNNLLSNAVKFTEPGGTIGVKQTTENGFIRVSISDTGCGIAQDSVRHIFDKFYQGDTSHAAEGNGLGLALVYRVLKLLDGDIHVTSEPGKGTVFTVTLPQADSQKKENGDADKNLKWDNEAKDESEEKNENETKNKFGSRES